MPEYEAHYAGKGSLGLEELKDEVRVSEEIRQKARLAIERMLKII